MGKSKLQTWVTKNLGPMRESEGGDGLLDLVSNAVLGLATDKSIRSLSDRSGLAQLLVAWTRGATYQDLLSLLERASINVSGHNPTVEDAVALGEGGFGYDVAMLVAAIVDLVEPLDEDLHRELELVHKRVKYGLSLPSSIAMYEAGFADRVVASTLGALWPNAKDRSSVRAVCRSPDGGIHATLEPFPSYFASVAKELGRS